MILSRWHEDELQLKCCFVWFVPCLCRKLMQEALLSALRWQPKRAGMFANLYSYLIWNECHSHSLLFTATGANKKAKWTNRWVVCELLCLQGLSVMLLIRLIMHPESILQLVSECLMCVVYSRSTDYERACPRKLTAMGKGALLC